MLPTDESRWKGTVFPRVPYFALTSRQFSRYVPEGKENRISTERFPTRRGWTIPTLLKLFQRLS